MSRQKVTPKVRARSRPLKGIRSIRTGMACDAKLKCSPQHGRPLALPAEVLFLVVVVVGLAKVVAAVVAVPAGEGVADFAPAYWLVVVIVLP